MADREVMLTRINDELAIAEAEYERTGNQNWRARIQGLRQRRQWLCFRVEREMSGSDYDLLFGEFTRRREVIAQH